MTDVTGRLRRLRQLIQLAQAAPTGAILAACLQPLRDLPDTTMPGPGTFRARLGASDALPLLTGEQSPTHRRLVIALTDDPDLLAELASEALNFGADDDADAEVLFDHPHADTRTRMHALLTRGALSRYDAATGDVRMISSSTFPVDRERMEAELVRERAAVTALLAGPPDPDLCVEAVHAQSSEPGRRPDGRLHRGGHRMAQLLSFYAQHPLLDHATTMTCLRTYVAPGTSTFSSARSALLDMCRHPDLLTVLSRDRDGGLDPRLLTAAVTSAADGVVTPGHPNSNMYLFLLEHVLTLLPEHAGDVLLRACAHAPYLRAAVAARRDASPQLLADLAVLPDPDVHTSAAGPVPLPGFLVGDTDSRAAVLRSTLESLAGNPVTPVAVLRTVELSSESAATALGTVLARENAGERAWQVAVELEQPDTGTVGMWADTLLGIAADRRTA